MPIVTGDLQQIASHVPQFPSEAALQVGRVLALIEHEDSALGTPQHMRTPRRRIDDIDS